ncbi:GNAT family N-acetyltransferase [Owenweeksia hongkongensis]|uniref:GNAT family N-acetyltransferase n=1 Tax=Owenweeksia hongkongensis TaxID=253245 RepID=UPI003A8D772B
MRAVGEIRCHNLVLRDFSSENLTSSYVSWLNDLDVVRFSRQRFSKHSLDSCRAFFKQMEKSDEFFVAILEADNGFRHIGNLTTVTDTRNQVVDLAILLGEKSIWGRGYAQSAWSAMMEFLLNTSEIRMVTGGCMADNAAMKNVMIKTGMKHYYTKKNYFIRDGEFCDSVHYFRESA